MASNLRAMAFNPRVMASNLRVMASNLRAMAFNPRVMASNLRAMAFNLRVMASNPRAMASNPRVMASNLRAMAFNLRVMASNLRVMASNLLASRIPTQLESEDFLTSHCRVCTRLARLPQPDELSEARTPARSASSRDTRGETGPFQVHFAEDWSDFDKSTSAFS